MLEAIFQALWDFPCTKPHHHGFYTIIVAMPRIPACIPWHRHGYRQVGIRAYATGYRQVSVAFGTILMSVALRPEDIGRYIRGICHGIDAPNPSLSLIAYLSHAQHNDLGRQQI